MKSVYQRINSVPAIFFGNISEMCIAGRCSGTGMAKQCLDMTQAQAAFKKMRGKTVPKGVNRDFF